MLLPMALNSMYLAQKEQQINEILQLNDQSGKYGLTLTGIEVSKNIISSFSNSSFIMPDAYTATLHELHEIFYHMKNETQDKIGDEALIKLIKDYFETSCGGSLEQLKGMLQIFADDFRKKHWQEMIAPKEDIT
jgi:hypothetical protein